MRANGTGLDLNVKNYSAPEATRAFKLCKKYLSKSGIIKYATRVRNKQSLQRLRGTFLIFFFCHPAWEERLRYPSFILCSL